MHIVFVHGLRQSSGSWGSLRALVAASLAATQSEFIYDARLIGFSSPNRAARSLITHLNKFKNDNEIVVVGYSLGGLVARKAMQLLLSREVDDPELLKRIKFVVTLGTPLSGARIQIGRRLSLNPYWIRFIQEQASSSRIPYKLAITTAGDIGRPKFFHIQFEGDEWVSDHDEAAYTVDDNNAGTLPGSHTGFDRTARGEEIAQEIASVIRRAFAYAKKADDAVIPTAAGAVAAPVQGDSYSALILVACSNRKDTSQGDNYEPPKAGEWLNHRTLQNKLLEKRASIMDKLKAHKVIDYKFSQGNRGDRDQNVHLKRGPDFGVASEHKAYLPAVQRYRGRFYLPLQGFNWEQFHAQQDRPLVLIMSALYGLVQSNECIQDYDAGMSDIDLSSSASLKDLWSDWLTAAINAFIERHGKKVRIFDLLSDPDYTSAIRWSDLKREHCSVFHLISDKWQGIDLLPAAGVVARGLLEQPNLIAEMERTSASERHIYDLSKFGEVTADYTGTQVAFERSIGDLPTDFSWAAEAAA